MSTPSKYKIGDKINDWIVKDIIHGRRRPYICQCSCGILKDKDAPIKNKCCKQCISKYPRKTRFVPLCNIGDIFCDRKVIEIDYNSKRNKYVCECKCGKISKRQFYAIKKPGCQRCSLRKKTKYHIGKTYQNLEVLDINGIKNKTKLIVRCIVCNYEFSITKSCISSSRKWCKNCIKGNYPGKKIGMITFLERKGDSLWNLLCECGKEFSRSASEIKNNNFSCGCDKRSLIISKAHKKIGIKYKYLKISGIVGFKKKTFVFRAYMYM